MMMMMMIMITNRRVGKGQGKEERGRLCGVLQTEGLEGEGNEWKGVVLFLRIVCVATRRCLKLTGEL
jgi:hypothetical protein